MKKIVVFLSLVLVTNRYSAGESCPTFNTTMGVPVNSSVYGNYTVYFNYKDSFDLEIRTNSKHPVSIITLRFDNDPVNVPISYGYVRVKLPCKDGIYKIFAKNSSCYAEWTIKLIGRPHIVDTTSAVSQTTAITPIKILNPDFLFYPNPATKELNLLNETDEIKSITFYNSSGHFISKFEVNSAKAKIPLENYPTGVYFMHVATLSDKIIIKKISVL